MTLNDWLNVALRNLAPAAQERMTAEYRAHVQDAMTGGLTEPEAVATLGDPAQVNRALRRTYLMREEQKTLQLDNQWVWRAMTVLLLGYGASLLMIGGAESSGPLAGVVTAVTLGGTAWCLLRSRPDALRNYLLNQLGGWLVNFSFWLGWSVQAWLGDPPSFGAILWLLPALWVVWFVEVGRVVRRIRRTLTLGGRA
ncbi:hypothetical protein [Deinococcus sp. RIT780]|uniref:HAAS signaling domain-containing protein n=1 Tax=Deinococcus sp. RIT780 TaxID=2870472 RepID=UPI001C89F0E8|nr:hypothetical protein [Deinococcus sp. RIT780]MBX8464038.1 hypothetical protein [Deinococcus sp. RIT780]